MTDLRDASGRLREVVRAMMEKPGGGVERNEGLSKADAALVDVQRAIIALTPNIPVNTPPDLPTNTYEQLQQAVQRLRDAEQAMVRQPGQRGTDQAAQLTHRALLESEQAIAALPPALRTAAGVERASAE